MVSCHKLITFQHPVNAVFLYWNFWDDNPNTYPDHLSWMIHLTRWKTTRNVNSWSAISHQGQVVYFWPVFKDGCDLLVKELIELSTNVWQSESVPTSWNESIVVYIFKTIHITCGITICYQFHPNYWLPSYSANCSIPAKDWVSRDRLNFVLVKDVLIISPPPANC